MDYWEKSLLNKQAVLDLRHNFTKVLRWEAVITLKPFQSLLFWLGPKSDYGSRVPTLLWGLSRISTDATVSHMDFFFWLGPMWICPIRRHARQREDGGTSFKGLVRCHCLTVLEIVYITHLWSVISPHFTLPLDTVKRNEKKKPCLFLLSTNQCKDQRSSFLMSPLFIWSGHTPGTLRVICPVKVTLTWRTKISLTYNSYFRVSSLCPFEAYCKAVLWLPDSFVLQLRVFFFLLSFLSTSSAPPLQHLGSLATQSSHCIPS